MRIPSFEQLVEENHHTGHCASLSSISTRSINPPIGWAPVAAIERAIRTSDLTTAGAHKLLSQPRHLRCSPGILLTHEFLCRSAQAGFGEILDLTVGSLWLSLLCV